MFVRRQSSKLSLQNKTLYLLYLSLSSFSCLSSGCFGMGLSDLVISKGQSNVSCTRWSFPLLARCGPSRRPGARASDPFCRLMGFWLLEISGLSPSLCSPDALDRCGSWKLWAPLWQAALSSLPHIISRKVFYQCTVHCCSSSFWFLASGVWCSGIWSS